MKSKSSNIFSSWFSGVAFCALVSATAFAAGPKLQVLHSFTGGQDGMVPLASLVADQAGNLYGTTSVGGTTANCFGGTGCGTVFELSPPRAIGGPWKETILYRFKGSADGAFPIAGLIFDQTGNLYGTAAEGGTFNGVCGNGQTDWGCGVVFKLSPIGNGTWAENVIYSFAGQGDGDYPAANLIFDAAGNLYGAAELGGLCVGCGTVFELTPNGSQNWIESTLYQFQAAFDGALPTAGLIFDQTGNLYGTARAGGAFLGTVFELLPPAQQGQQWTEATLFQFSESQNEPRGSLIFDAAGNLYGTASSNDGAVFELSPSGDGTWNENTIYAFGNNHASSPVAGVVADSHGNLYGTTAGRFCGSLYRLEKNANGVWNQAEHDFFKGSTPSPCTPEASLIFGKWGALYGTSASSANCQVADTCGTVFGILP